MQVITYTISGEKFETTMDATELAMLETLAANSPELEIIGSRALKLRSRARRRAA